MKNLKTRKVFHYFLISITLVIKQAYGAMGMPANEKPINFSWFTESKLCSMARPKKIEHVQWLEKNNIGLIVVITPQIHLYNDLIKQASLQWFFLEIKDNALPSSHQLTQTIATIEKMLTTEKAVCICCIDGSKQTDNIFISWLIEKEKKNPKEAFQTLQMKRFIQNLSPKKG